MNYSLFSYKLAQKLSELLNYQVSVDLLIALIVVMELIGEIFQISYLMNLKPIPIIFLIGKSMFVVDCNSNITKALAFCVIGDILLMIDTLYFFQVGTISFLIGHICYIAAFLKDFQISEPHFKFQKKFPYIMTFLILIFLVVNNIILWELFPDKIVFPLYGIVLSTMAATSLYRFKEKKLSYYVYGVAGALLFMISDTIIGHTKLKKGESAIDGAIIMTLYYTGQFLILKGNSKQKMKLSCFQSVENKLEVK